MKTMWTVIATLALLVVVSSSAFAQAPPMDMSWAINAQNQYWQMGNAAANNAAMTYYNYMLRLRQMGYTGPSLPTGVTQQSLQNSINAANQATQNYIQGSMVNSQKTYNTAADYDYRAIRGCSLTTNAYGQRVYWCP